MKPERGTPETNCERYFSVLFALGLEARKHSLRCFAKAAITTTSRTSLFAKCSINGGGGVLCFKSPYLSVTGGRLSALDLRQVFIVALLLDFFLWVAPDLL